MKKILMIIYNSLKENNYEIGETPDIQLFIIENNEIVGCTYVPRKDVYTYQPEENEYLPIEDPELLELKVDVACSPLNTKSVPSFRRNLKTTFPIKLQLSTSE